MPLKPADWPYCPLPDTLKRASSQSSPLPRFCEVLRRNDGQHVTASFFLLCQCNKTFMHQIWKFNQWRNWYSSNKQKIHIYTAQTGFFKKCVSISVCFFVSLFYLGFKSLSFHRERGQGKSSPKGAGACMWCGDVLCPSGRTGFSPNPRAPLQGSPRLLITAPLLVPPHPWPQHHINAQTAGRTEEHNTTAHKQQSSGQLYTSIFHSGK